MADSPGRKFVLCVFAHLLNIIMAGIGYLPPESFVQLSMFILGGYVTANVAQKALTKEK